MEEFEGTVSRGNAFWINQVRAVEQESWTEVRRLEARVKELEGTVSQHLIEVPLLDRLGSDYRGFQAIRGALDEYAERLTEPLRKRTAELEADLEHCRKVDAAHIKGARAHSEGKPLAENPYPLDWEADYGTTGWTDKLLHGVWEDAWGREEELDLLLQIAVAAKRWVMDPDYSECKSEREIREALTAYEQSGCALPPEWDQG